MPELDLHKTHKGFEASQKASRVYGNQSIEDNSPSAYPFTSAWICSPQPPLTRAYYRTTAAVNQEEHDAIIYDCPFTQTDLLDSEENKIQELIFRIRTSCSISHWERLANRLLTLYNDAKEEDSASPGIALGSLRNFYKFLQLHTDLKCPTISLTPDNNIYASWREVRNRVFSVHFLSNGDVRFVIFKPNDRHPERQIRISGTATTDILMETVTPNGLGDWIAE
jgi:hypothetical protein